MSEHVRFLDMKGTRVYLRPPEKSDLPFFRRSMNDERITRFLLHHNPLSEKEEEEWFDRVSKIREHDRICTIVLKETHEPIGSMGLHNIDWINGTATTGAWIGKQELLGKGLGTEAKMLWLKYVFLGLNLRQVYSRIHQFNPRSMQYARKCGYVEIARYPEFIFRDGTYHDLVHFLVTLKEWLPLWKEFEQKMKGEADEQN